MSIYTISIVTKRKLKLRIKKSRDHHFYLYTNDEFNDKSNARS